MTHDLGVLRFCITAWGRSQKLEAFVLNHGNEFPRDTSDSVVNQTTPRSDNQDRYVGRWPMPEVSVMSDSPHEANDL